MFNYFKKIYSREQFHPRFWGIFINPFYFARRGLYRAVSEFIVQLNGKLLDVGCGTKPYEHLTKVDEYIGLEIENKKNSKADYFYDGKKMPFADKTFDSVLCNQVFEHVFNPADFLKELNRVSKIDALLLLSVPFVWDEHEQPYDYARYSSFGLRHILNQHGFEILEHRKTNNGIEVIFQFWNAYLYKVISAKKNYTASTEVPYIRLLLTLIFMAPVNIVGSILSKILPRNHDLYLDNVILAKKIKNV